MTGKPQARGSIVTVTDDATALRCALRPGGVDYTITAPGRFAARHTLIRLHRVQMQSVEESLPRIVEGEISRDRRGISFLQCARRTMFSNAEEIGPAAVALHAPASLWCQRLSGPTRWAAISLPVQDWLEVGVALLGHDMTPAPDVAAAIPSEAGLAKLRHLHAAVVHLAHESPELVANPAAAGAMDAELIIALAETLSPIGGQRPGEASRRHARIMQRFRECLEEYSGKPLYLPELCAKLGTPGRTLRLCCEESFGMGPKRYLHLRRLNLARRALEEPTPPLADVTSIATQFGFWELGRFAVEYRRLFGESPSATLRKALASRGCHPTLLPKLHSAVVAAGLSAR